MLTGWELTEAIRAEKTAPPSGIATLGLDVTHHWIESLDPGQVVMRWAVDDRYLNLDGAVICSWLSALGDQAIFFAVTAACETGRATRMSSFSLDILDDVTSGELLLEAHLDRRVGDRAYATCAFSLAGQPVARMSAVLDVRDV